MNKRNFLTSAGSCLLGVSIFPSNKAIAVPHLQSFPELQLGDLVKRRYAPHVGTASGWGYAAVVGLMLREEVAYIQAYHEEVDRRCAEQEKAYNLGVPYTIFCKSNPWPYWLRQGFDESGNPLSPNPTYTRRGYMLQPKEDTSSTVDLWVGLGEIKSWQLLLPGEIVAPNEVQYEELPTHEAIEERIRNPLGPFFLS